MKKLLFRFSIVVAGIVLAVGLVRLGIIFSVYYIGLWENNANFEDYEEEFLLIANYVEEIPEDFDFLYVSSVKGSDVLQYDLYDPEKKEYLNCPQEVKEAMTTVEREAFAYGSPWETIHREENGTISFRIEAGYYSLVYSPTHEPESILPAESESRVLWQKIRKGWYHVVTRG